MQLQLCTQGTENKGKCGIGSSLPVLNSYVFLFSSFSLSFFLCFFLSIREAVKVQLIVD